MGGWKLVGLMAAIVLLTPGFSGAENEGRIEPLDGAHSRVIPPTGLERAETHPSLIPDNAGRPLARTPFGSPLPPSQLTPAPVLPLNPNRALTPSPSTPSSSAPPFSGGGRAGR